MQEATAPKRCPCCGETKPHDAFAVDRTKPSGRKSWCKDCDNARSRDYYNANWPTVLAKANARNAERCASRPPRRCATCTAPATSSQHYYCDRCRVEARQGKHRRPRSKSTVPLTGRCGGCHHAHAPNTPCVRSLPASVLLGLSDEAMLKWNHGEAFTDADGTYHPAATVWPGWATYAA